MTDLKSTLSNEPPHILVQDIGKNPLKTAWFAVKYQYLGAFCNNMWLQQQTKRRHKMKHNKKITVEYPASHSSEGCSNRAKLLLEALTLISSRPALRNKIVVVPMGHDAVFSGPQSLAYSDIRNHVIMTIEHIRVCHNLLL